MNPVAAKLSTFVELSAEEVNAIAAVMANTVVVPSRTLLATQGDEPKELYFLLEGMMVRHKELVDGSRQILSILLPGDACDIGVTLLDQRDHSITAAGPCRIARVSDSSIEWLSTSYPRIRAAFRWATLSEEAITREWLVNVGQRDAVARTAHFLCELFHRNLAIGQVHNQSIVLPLTQHEIADVLGISSVHMNRVLQELRASDLFTLYAGRLTIHSLQALEDRASFDPSYLHLAAHFDRSGGTALLRGGKAVTDRLQGLLSQVEQSVPTAPEASTSPGAPLAGRTVLVVEDDFYAALEMTNSLKAAGAEVMGPYANEADAFKGLLHTRPTAAVLDIRLGGVPAFELARVLHETGIPLIFATAYDRSHLPSDLAKSAHVQKPFEGGDLIETVRVLA